MATQAARAYGPSALGGSTRRFIELTLTLARTDFKLRYFGSALGYVWQLVRPLLFFGVIYVFFTKVLNVDKGIPGYGLYLLTAIVIWTFFAEATGNSVACLVNRENMLRKIRFPRLAVPIAVTLTSVFNLIMNSIVVVVFALISGIDPRWSWLWMFPILLGFIVFTMGMGMLLSAAYVRFRDVQPIWDVVVQILFYASPIMYVASRYKHLEHLAMLNPLGMMLTQMGHAFVHPGSVSSINVVYHQGYVTNRLGGALHPGTIATQVRTAAEPVMRSAYQAAGGYPHLLASIAIIPIVFIVGLAFFTHEAPRVAENL
jgi:ABC-2 type transport system permease protein